MTIYVLVQDQLQRTIEDAARVMAYQEQGNWLPMETHFNSQHIPFLKLI